MDPLTLVGLTLAVFATATLSGMVGMGGGVTLLAIMAATMPPPLVVPLHGVIQLFSNGTRAFLFLRHVHHRIFAFYMIPAGLGVFVGARWYVGSSLPWFKPVIGIFIIGYLATVVRKPAAVRMPVWGFAILGAVTGTAASLIGATGPLIAPFFLRDDITKEEVVATKAAVQVVTHLAKLPAFFALGFAYGAWALELVPLCVAAVAGTMMGKRLLTRMDAEVFRRFFMVVLLAIAVHLIASGIG
ncbi:MAG: putative membrane protein YfcA [Hyphomicrobiaceae bacterium]|jgi:uncharacterized membrane protein YfcA